jgi:hypothetical protein
VYRADYRVLMQEEFIGMLSENVSFRVFLVIGGFFFIGPWKTC